MKVHRIFGLMACSYLIETPEGLFLVDAGFVGHGRSVSRRIRALDRSPDDLRLVIVTHGHLDHFGGIAEVLRTSRPPVAAHPAHIDAIARADRLVSPGRTRWGRAYERVARAVMPRLTVHGTGDVLGLEDGQELRAFGLQGRVIYTPGHSEGCITVLLDGGTALTGDLIQGKRLPTRMPELPNMLLDAERTYDSWRKVLSAGAHTFLPAHGRPFSAEELLSTMRRDGIDPRAATTSHSDRCGRAGPPETTPARERRFWAQ